MWSKAITILIPLSIVYKTMASEIKHESMQSVMENFQIKNPVIWTLTNTSLTKQIIKHLFSMGHSCQVGTKHLIQNMKKDLQDNIIIVDKAEEIIGSVLELSNIAVVVFLGNFDFEKATFLTKVEIHKKVFIIKEKTSEVFEAYVINNHQVIRKLGRFENQHLIWESNVKRNFVLRRSDFYGMTLTAMTSIYGENSDYKEKATYFKNNQTYLVNQFTNGMLYDILIILQKSLNFTTNLYQRSDNAWGSVYPQGNGSFHATGMVSDIFFGRADFILAELSITYQRALYIDFIRPIGPDNNGLFIPSGNTEGEFQFDILLSLFR